jgi:hypothetical protein
VPDELGQVRIIPVLQSEAVALPVEDDCLPPAVFQGLLGNDQMARRDLIPGPRQPKGYRQAVAVLLSAACGSSPRADARIIRENRLKIKPFIALKPLIYRQN